MWGLQPYGRSFFTSSSLCLRSIAAAVAQRQGSPERRIAYTRSHIFRRATAYARSLDFVLRSRLLKASWIGPSSFTAVWAARPDARFKRGSAFEFVPCAGLRPADCRIRGAQTPEVRDVSRVG